MRRTLFLSSMALFLAEAVESIQLSAGSTYDNQATVADFDEWAQVDGATTKGKPVDNSPTKPVEENFFTVNDKKKTKKPAGSAEPDIDFDDDFNSMIDNIVTEGGDDTGIDADDLI